MNYSFGNLLPLHLAHSKHKFAERAGRAGADAGHADRGCDDVPAAPRHDGRRPRLRLQPQLCRPRGREEHVLGRHPQVIIGLNYL